MSKKIKSLRIEFTDGSDYSAQCDNGLDYDEATIYLKKSYETPAEPQTRELKFRIWDKKAEAYMILGATGIDARNGEVVDYYNEGRTLGGQEEYVVEQYTGSKDKNGKEIYEGDLVKVSDAPAIEGKTLVVKFGEYDIGEYACDRMVGWMVQVVGEEWETSLADEVDRCEVVGNIHEGEKND